MYNKNPNKEQRLCFRRKERNLMFTIFTLRCVTIMKKIDSHFFPPSSFDVSLS